MQPRLNRQTMTRMRRRIDDLEGDTRPIVHSYTESTDDPPTVTINNVAGTVADHDDSLPTVGGLVDYVNARVSAGTVDLSNVQKLNELYVSPGHQDSNRLRLAANLADDKAPTGKAVWELVHNKAVNKPAILTGATTVAMGSIPADTALNPNFTASSVVDHPWSLLLQEAVKKLCGYTGDVAATFVEASFAIEPQSAPTELELSDDGNTSYTALTPPLGSVKVTWQNSYWKHGSTQIAGSALVPYDRKLMKYFGTNGNSTDTLDVTGGESLVTSGATHSWQTSHQMTALGSYYLTMVVTAKRGATGPFHSLSGVAGAQTYPVTDLTKSETHQIKTWYQPKARHASSNTWTGTLDYAGNANKVYADTTSFTVQAQQFIGTNTYRFKVPEHISAVRIQDPLTGHPAISTASFTTVGDLRTCEFTGVNTGMDPNNPTQPNVRALFFHNGTHTGEISFA